MKLLVMVLAGGQGSRLKPLTTERSEPAVPFGSRCRIIDFVLSNLVNSEIYSIYLRIQYKSQSLIEHMIRHGGMVTVSQANSPLYLPDARGYRVVLGHV